MSTRSRKMILPFEKITKNDVELVGGKNANLGEMINKAHVQVPTGFAVTAYAYRYFIEKNKLQGRINKVLEELVDIDDTKKLKQIGKKIRQMILKAKIPKTLEKEIRSAYKKLGGSLVSVRSSATAEDLPGASFAGQQETYLNVKGSSDVVKYVKECFASLYTDRAIFYREEKGFEHEKVALSVAVQRMINSRSAGVIFSLDVRNGQRDVVTVEGSYGLGEFIVQGRVTPDDFFVRKKDLKILERNISNKTVMLKAMPKGGIKEMSVPKTLRGRQVLTDAQVKELAKYCIKLEKHYKMPQDTEWAVDDDTGKLFILQTRPETAWTEKTIKHIKARISGEKIVKGLPASPGAGCGKAKIILKLKDLAKVEKGEVLVTKMTNPDMVATMRKACAIVTNEGGITSHAAIVSRELGVPCVVGTSEGTKKIREGQVITVDGTAGVVYKGDVCPTKTAEEEKLPVPRTRTKVYVNLGIPEIAVEVAKKPADGVGLMREEFILATYVKEHPLALLKKGKEKVFIDKLASGIEKVVKAFKPRPVVLRLSDFKTNEYRELKGGEKFEPKEENPMIGWRGCSRYVSAQYRPAFEMELKAVAKVRKKYKNLWIMLPFVRTVDEVKKIVDMMEAHGLKRSKTLKLWLMAEVPCNIFLADEFSKLVDGFSIGSNDLTQLVLGVDRDSELLGKMGYFNERNEAVTRAIAELIRTAHKYKKTVSICGQAPSNYPEFTEFLVRHGIDSISVNPDTIEKTKRIVAEAEKKRK